MGSYPYPQYRESVKIAGGLRHFCAIYEQISPCVKKRESGFPAPLRLGNSVFMVGKSVI
jgi:hypothetical protein